MVMSVCGLCVDGVKKNTKLCPSEAEELDVSESDKCSRSTYFEGLSFDKFTLY